MLNQIICSKRKNVQLLDYNYSLSGSYFVIICTEDRIDLFGDIIEGEMRLNQYGMIVKSVWDNVINHYDGILLDEFIVIDDIVGMMSPLYYKCKIKLGNIIAYFKYQTTKYRNKIRGTPVIRVWQRNYYDHIVHDEKSYSGSRNI